MDPIRSGCCATSRRSGAARKSPRSSGAALSAVSCRAAGPVRSAAPKPPTPRPSKSHIHSYLPSPKYRYSNQDLTALSTIGLARERSNRTRDLVEQGADLRAVIDIVGRQLRRDDPARISIHTDVELAPGPAHPRAMLLDQPLPGPAELQARAVHQQVHRFGIAVRPRPRHLQALRPAAQGGMVGNREIETKQTDNGADQPLGLAQGQAEYS